MADKESSKRLLHEGIQAARAGDDNEARRLLLQATRLNPEDPDVWFWLGLMLEDPDKQLKCMLQALALDPNHARAREAVETLTADQEAPALPENGGETEGALEPAPPPLPRTRPSPDVGTPTPVPPLEAVEPPATVPSVPVSAARPEPLPGEVRNDAITQAAAHLVEASAAEKRRGLIRAWGAALLFDGERAYEVYRGRADPVPTALLVVAVITAALLLSAFVQLSDLLGVLDAGALLRFFGQSFLYALLTGAQVALALFTASWVAATMARRRFGSEVGAGEHFGLSGLFAVPASLVFVALVAATTLAANALGGVVALTSVPYTMFVFFVYLVAQFVYSTSVIHRVGAWPAVMISTAALLVAGLVFVWLLPITTLLVVG
mgnify:CR=1 FL=1